MEKAKTKMLQGHWEVENPGRSRPGASLTFTPVAGLALLVPCRALALVGSHGVDAIPALAEARDGLALIHICGKRSKGVRELDPCPVWIFLCSKELDHIPEGITPQMAPGIRTGNGQE